MTDTATHTVEWIKSTPTHEFVVTLINNDVDAYYRVSVACVDADGDPLISEYVTGRYDNREAALRHAALQADIVGWGR